jgi:hypothetical protein
MTPASLSSTYYVHVNTHRLVAFRRSYQRNQVHGNRTAGLPPNFPDEDTETSSTKMVDLVFSWESK